MSAENISSGPGYDPLGVFTQPVPGQSNVVSSGGSVVDGDTSSVEVAQVQATDDVKKGMIPIAPPALDQEVRTNVVTFLRKLEEKKIAEGWVELLERSSSNMWDKFRETVEKVSAANYAKHLQKMLSEGGKSYDRSVAESAISSVLAHGSLSTMRNLFMLEMLSTGGDYMGVYNPNPTAIAETFANFVLLQVNSSAFGLAIWSYANDRVMEAYGQPSEQELAENDALKQEILQATDRWVSMTRANILYTTYGALRAADGHEVKGIKEEIDSYQGTGDVQDIVFGMLLSERDTLETLYPPDQVDRYFNEWGENANHALFVQELIKPPLSLIQMINALEDFTPDNTEDSVGRI